MIYFFIGFSLLALAMVLKAAWLSFCALNPPSSFDKAVDQAFTNIVNGKLDDVRAGVGRLANPFRSLNAGCVARTDTPCCMASVPCGYVAGKRELSPATSPAFDDPLRLRRQHSANNPSLTLLLLINRQLTRI